jgi:hypothetical protein
MKVDSVGNLLPKTMEGALIAAHAYLLYNQPPPNNPWVALQWLAIVVLGMIGVVLTPDGKQSAEKEKAPR